MCVLGGAPTCQMCDARNYFLPLYRRRSGSVLVLLVATFLLSRHPHTPHTPPHQSFTQDLAPVLQAMAARRQDQQGAGTRGRAGPSIRVEEQLVTCITHDVQRGVLFMGTQRGSVFLFRIGMDQGTLAVKPFRYVRPSSEVAGTRAGTRAGAAQGQVVDVGMPVSCLTSVRSV